jgi:hypothetical protein
MNVRLLQSSWRAHQAGNLGVPQFFDEQSARLRLPVNRLILRTILEWHPDPLNARSRD